MTNEYSQMIDKLTHIGVYRRNGKRAIHKPLLVLLALADVQRGGSGSFRYLDVQARLHDLLREFSTTASSAPRAHYPFWYLKNDKIWFIEDEERLSPRTGKGPGGEPSNKRMKKVNPLGGLRPEIVAGLKSEPTLLDQASRTIAEVHFGVGAASSVLQAVGLRGDDIS